MNGPKCIINARLIDGSGASVPDELQTVIIEGSVITAVGPSSILKCPAGTVPIDAAGCTVMPGLIDCHDHLANLEGSMSVRAVVPPTLAVFKTAEVFKDTLMGGFTSIRDASGVDQGMKMAVEQGLIPGPRLKISINILSQSGGHNDHTEAAGINSVFPLLPGIPDCICDGPAECRKRTREMIRAGADWIKIAATGGVGTPVGGPLLRQFSPEEVLAIVDTAHAAGKPVMSHAYGGDGVKICLDAGVDSIEHGAVINDAIIEQMVRQGTWLVPTFTVLRKIAALADIDPCPVPSYMPEKALFLLQHQNESFRKAVQAGVKIALGTDSGGFGHGRNAGELKYLVEAGMTSLQAITAATGMGADCMGLGDETGLLKEGMFADLLVVNGDPLIDVSILENRDNLCLIMKNGDIIKNNMPEGSV